MTRRLFAASCAAATSALAIPATQAKDGWITVAHPGENLCRRIYSERALQAMCDGLNGKPVVAKDTESMEPESINDIAGFVVDTRRGSDGEVQVRVRWVSSADTTAMTLAPSGNAIDWTNEGTRSDQWPMTITEYEPVSLVLSGYSSFERATEL